MTGLVAGAEEPDRESSRVDAGGDPYVTGTTEVDAERVDSPVLPAPAPVVAEPRYDVAPERLLGGLAEVTPEWRGAVFPEPRRYLAYERDDPRFQRVEHAPEPVRTRAWIVAVEHGVVGMLGVNVACFLPLERQYTFQMRREQGPLRAFAGLDPGPLGERRRARSLCYQPGRQPARPVILSSGETQNGGLIGAWLVLAGACRSEEHTSELQSRQYLVCRLLLEKKKKTLNTLHIIYKKKTTK